MKKIIFCGLAMLLCTAFAADDKKSAELEKLLGERKKVVKEMYNLRIKLIKNDPSIKKLHQRIIALHKELSLKIDSKKEMRVLIEQEKRLNAQIEQLNKQLDKKEK